MKIVIYIISIYHHYKKSMYLLVLYHILTYTRLENKRHENIKSLGNKSFENVAKFTHLKTTATSQTFVGYKINSRLNSENAYTNQSTNFYILVFYLRRELSENTALLFCLFFCINVKLCISL